ncbi:MAG: hypothetical protein FWC78_06830 [Defluviitaleaceae bacterium]|nr:hypothetical protein [Defluviitaleaceae bacterium]
MKQWTATWGNDPDDDYNLVLEIICNDKEVAVIKQCVQGLILKWYISPKGLAIPANWLVRLLLDSKKEIVDPTTVTKEIVIEKWTIVWPTDQDPDRNRILKILCVDEEVAIVKQNQQEVILEWIANPKGLIIQADWLLELLLAVNEKMAST